MTEPSPQETAAGAAADPEQDWDWEPDSGSDTSSSDSDSETPSTDAEAASVGSEEQNVAKIPHATEGSVSTAPASPPYPRLLGHLIEEHFVEDRKYRPMELKPLVRERGAVRDVRIGGVKMLKSAILASGWTRSSVMIAHDRGDGNPPVLLDGAHRVGALLEIFHHYPAKFPVGRWYPAADFTVTVKILKGLSRIEEKVVAREANWVNTKKVKVSLVDQVVGMYNALKTCREVAEKEGKANITASFLINLHQDYCRYHPATVRSWKRLAEGFGMEAMHYLRGIHQRSDFLGPNGSGLVKHAFSKKTLVESRVMQILKGKPGAQLWYLRRLVELEANDKLKDLNAEGCGELAGRLKSMADILERFADFVADRQNNLRPFARAMRTLVHAGKPKEDPEIQDRSERNRNRLHLQRFAEWFLYRSKKDSQWRETFQLHGKDRRYYPDGLLTLIANSCFSGSRRDAEDALGFPLDVNFCTMPRDDNLLESSSDDEPPRKKRKQKKTADRRVQDKAPREQSTEEQVTEEAQQQSPEVPTSPDVQQPQTPKEQTPAEVQSQQDAGEDIQPEAQKELHKATPLTDKHLQESSFEVQVRYHNQELGEQVFKFIEEALREHDFGLEDGEVVRVIRKE